MILKCNYLSLLSSKYFFKICNVLDEYKSHNSISLHLSNSSNITSSILKSSNHQSNNSFLLFLGDIIDNISVSAFSFDAIITFVPSISISLISYG